MKRFSRSISFVLVFVIIFEFALFQYDTEYKNILYAKEPNSIGVVDQKIKSEKDTSVKSGTSIVPTQIPTATPMIRTPQLTQNKNKIPLHKLFFYNRCTLTTSRNNHY